MSQPVVSRRAVLGGVAAGIAAAGIAPAWAARAAGDPIDTVAAALDRRLIALRRDLHRHPEAPGQERRTAAVVARELRAAGLDVVTGVGGHGVVGLLEGSRPGRTVAYRADMDAVPPHGQLGGDGKVAHVCGHDLHTAVGVGIAQVLARLRARLSGRVMFVFQPAEETLTGAAAMLGDGVFARARPTEIHALHCYAFPVGEFATTAGYGLPGQDQGVVTLTGPDAAARAERLTTDVGALGTVAQPAIPDGLDQVLTDVQTPDGPFARFVMLRARAVGTEVQFSYRCWPEDRYTEVRAAIHRLAGQAGGTVSFAGAPFPAMVCPEPEGRALDRYLRRTVGSSRVRRLHAAIPFSGEDFALFLREMPGTYTLLGVQPPRTPIAESYPHLGAFDPDERAIGHGVRAMAGWLATRARG